MVIEKEKGYNAIMIGCHDKKVDDNSIVAISPFNTKKGEWLSGLTEIISISEVFKMKKQLVAKDKNVITYLNKKRTEERNK